MVPNMTQVATISLMKTNINTHIQMLNDESIKLRTKILNVDRICEQSELNKKVFLGPKPPDAITVHYLWYISTPTGSINLPPVKIGKGSEIVSELL